MLKKWPEWKNIKSIVRVTRVRERIKKGSIPEEEISYYGVNLDQE